MKQPEWFHRISSSELVSNYHLAKTALVPATPNNIERMVWSAQKYAGQHHKALGVSYAMLYKRAYLVLEYVISCGMAEYSASERLVVRSRRSIGC
jgi:hypothetical protein